MIQITRVTETIVKFYENTSSDQKVYFTQDILNIVVFYYLGYPFDSISQAINALDRRNVSGLLQ